MIECKFCAGVLINLACGKYCGWAVQDCLNDLFVFNTTTKRCVAAPNFQAPKEFCTLQIDGLILDFDCRWTNLTGHIRGFTPHARESMGLTAIGNFLYLFGGQGPEGQQSGLGSFPLKSLHQKCRKSELGRCLKWLEFAMISVQARPSACSLARGFSMICTKYENRLTANYAAISVSELRISARSWTLNLWCGQIRINSP